MNYDAQKVTYQEVTIFDRPALFTECRIDRATVPEGVYRYELRHGDADWGEPIELSRSLMVNFYGTVLTREPFQLPIDGWIPLESGCLSFQDGGCRTLAEFQEKYPASDKDVIDFYSVNEPALHALYFSRSEEQDKSAGCVGHLRGDFGSGKQFYTTWWPHQQDALNTPEFKADIDRMLKLPVPEAHYHNIALKPSEYQKDMVASLAERAEKVRNRKVDSSVDNMLLITNDGRKLALDQRLVNPMLPSDPNSKAAKCAENVFEIWRRTADKRSTQMIFWDLSTPKDDGAFSVYDDIRAKLLELGIPENEIAFIHNAKSEAQKKDLFGKVRSGQVRILLGSTQRMGAGTNCQQKLIALHHLECPWRPSDLQQREGRIIRQGNENPEVDIYSYVTEGTFDAYLYQLVESKQKFISQIMTSKSPVRSAEDVDEQALSYAEIKALASGNPMIKEKMDLDIEVSKLKLLKANHLSQKYALEDAISKGFPKQIAETQARITGYGADIATVKENTHPNGDGFSPLTLVGVTHADKKEAGAALLTMCQTMLSPEATQVGSYRGLTLELSFDTFAREYRLTMIGQLRHTVTLGTDVFGNLQRMDNALEGLPIKEQACREQLSNLQTQLETAKAEVQKPFPREAELNTKTARLEELNTLLNLDHKEPEIVDAEPDEDQRPPERRRPQLQR